MRSVTISGWITGCLLFFLFVPNIFGQDSFMKPLKINDNWKFQKGDLKNAATPDFDDSKWRTLDLPHDWSVEGPLNQCLASATGYLPGGIGWYRKMLDIPVNLKDKKIYIYFEGVYRNGEVFINGVSLGMRPNGYISFQYDLTPYLKFGEKNILAVRVDHSKSADSRWYTGSGIYRNVFLVEKNPVHLDLWGLFYTTRQLSDKKSSVQVQTTVKNTTAKQVSLAVVQELFDDEQKSKAKTVEVVVPSPAMSLVF
jgi:beta-galactosidase/beta-glucuronidase